MKHILIVLIMALACISCNSNKEKTVTIKLLQTSDVHGNYYPYNFINRSEWGGSLARVSSVADSLRKEYGDHLLLVDNGDILQGQPSAYYYNFIDTTDTHLCAEMLNYMNYDVGNVGNHDIETGHAVYDRWISECDFPVLGANIINTTTGEPYLAPYIIKEIDGVRIAILGMITPAIPAWLPENLWSGLRFDDMEETARKWIPIIKEKENPHIIIGLFHAGQSGDILVKYRQNPSVEIAERVPGFDIILMGHDHRRENKSVINCEGDTVLVINPANNARLLSSIDIIAKLDANGNLKSKRITGELLDMSEIAPDEKFINRFALQYDKIKSFVDEKIGVNSTDITTRDAFFGSSAFIDLTHSLQLAISGADISFAAPLSFDAKISKGDITMSDMFNLYKYENMLYVMELTGEEIKNYLEESYAIWTMQMSSASDHLLLFDTDENGKLRLKNPSFNFDSAAGICYTVDVSKPKGNKIAIQSMANGTPFDLNKTYKVAINSYRGNGGGELLTKGAGIPLEKLSDRIVSATDKDLRFYLMDYIKKQGAIDPKALNQWHFIPEKWVKEASARDYKILFGNE